MFPFFKDFSKFKWYSLSTFIDISYSKQEEIKQKMVVVIGAMAATITAIAITANEEEKKLKGRSEEEI